MAIIGTQRMKRRNRVKKRPERADVDEDVDDGRVEVAPGSRDEVAVERRHDDDEALEPHADVDEDRGDEHPGDAGARKRLNQNVCGESTLQVIIDQYAQA
jgi:hypothetical protein